MLEPAFQADVVVVGAGVAGLSAAHRLTRAGVTTTVLEAARCAGGRMATEKVDGFRLDRIGQLLFTSYPELRLTPGLDALTLRLFAPGVLLYSDGRRQRAGAPAGGGSARGALHAVRALASAPRVPPPARAPRALPSAAPRPASVPRGGGRPLGGAVTRRASGPRSPGSGACPSNGCSPARSHPPHRPSRSATAAPRRGFVRPLLAALLCDPDLTTSSRCADLALRAFAGGRMGLPEGGAEALPELLARALPPGTVRTGVQVTSVATTSVTTAEHGEFRCRAVLLATDARTAAELLPGLRVPDFHPVTVVHHTTDDPPQTGASLLLDADRGGPVAHTAVVSAVDPTRAPQGRALISSTVLGVPPADVDTAVRMHLARLYGTSTARWETLAVHHTAEAVPAMRPPHDLRRPVRLMTGLYVCGDHRDTSSVQGALHSGRRASAAILADLGAGSMQAAEPAPTPRAA
nr:NAD(P)/FAD-dependent oxidoreductase [Streptomyces sp. F001]